MKPLSFLRCGAVGVTLFLLARVGAFAEGAVYLDPGQPIDQRIDDLISQMTLEEKASTLYYKGAANARLHIPNWGGWNQCLHGVWSKQPTTLFPISTAAGATWDPDLIHEEATAISDEARALYNIQAPGVQGQPHGLVYRSPVVDLSRDPRWGRIQESFGEDPYLVSRIGVAFVQGLQGDDPKYLKLAATLKHFTLNNQEKDRGRLKAIVDERSLMEYWTIPFKASVIEGHARSIMAAYNAINGEPGAVNKFLLTDVLRGQWGFDGFVTSDLGGINQLVSQHKITDKKEVAVALALQAGCDYDDEEYRDGIPVAVRTGLLPESVLDQALRRVLRVAFQLGAFDPPSDIPYAKIPASVINSPEHRALALKFEREACVLLTNKDHFLPLDKGSLKTLAVIGPASEKPETGNYYDGPKPTVVSPLDGLQNRLGTDVTVLTAKGCGFLAHPATDPAEIEQAVQTAKQADAVILFLGTNLKVEAEARDRTDIALPSAQEQLLEAVVRANPKTVVVLSNAGPLSVKWAKENAAALVEAWYGGEEAGNAIADILLGNINPGGRLPYTMYESLDQIPPQSDYDVSHGFTYMYLTGTPLFPFGHGLSYTAFAYENLKLSAPKIVPDGTVTISLDVTNTGKLGGDEVVQLYLHQQASEVKQPIKKLVAFRRIRLGAGRKETVTFELPAAALALYDIAEHRFIVHPGLFDIMAGSSSEDIRLRDRLEVTAEAANVMTTNWRDFFFCKSFKN